MPTQCRTADALGPFSFNRQDVQAFGEVSYVDDCPGAISGYGAVDDPARNVHDCERFASTHIVYGQLLVSGIGKSQRDLNRVLLPHHWWVSTRREGPAVDVIMVIRR